MADVTAHDIAMMIDHSLLNPTFTRQQIIDGLLLAKVYGCVSVCVRPCDVALSAEVLRGSPVKVTTVVGFPHGSHCTGIKVAETKLAIAQGAVEVDMVQNIGWVLSGLYDEAEADIRAVVEEAHGSGALVKVIFENAYLNDEQKLAACRISAAAGADFTKTSTGYAPSGATLHDLLLMRANTPARMQVKAAGGVRKLDDALLVRAAGGSRFGCTRTKEMMDEARRREAAGTLVLPVIEEGTELSGAQKA